MRFGSNDGRTPYWSEADHHPFLIKVDGRLAGLALVKTVSEVWDMAEFFILRAYRRRGIGIKVAHQVWRRFPGRWQVRVMDSNRTALTFWQRAIASLTCEAIPPTRIEKDGERWHVFAFVIM